MPGRGLRSFVGLLVWPVVGAAIVTADMAYSLAGVGCRGLGQWGSLVGLLVGMTEMSGRPRSASWRSTPWRAGWSMAQPRRRVVPSPAGVRVTPSNQQAQRAAR